MDFPDDRARCVIIIGIPFPPLKARYNEIPMCWVAKLHPEMTTPHLLSCSYLAWVVKIVIDTRLVVVCKLFVVVATTLHIPSPIF